MIGGQFFFLYFRSSDTSQTLVKPDVLKSAEECGGHVATGRHLEGDPGVWNMHHCSSEGKNGGSTSFSQSKRRQTH